MTPSFPTRRSSDLVRRDQENDACILFLVADLPLAAKPVAIIRDVAPLEVADRRDDELMPGPLLKFEQLRVERGFLGRGDDIGLIDHRIAGELGEGLRGRDRKSTRLNSSH